VLTLVWGRLGLVAGVRRGVAAARTQVQVRREARTAAGASAEPGGEPAGPVAEQSWGARVAAWTRAFSDGLDLPDRTARLGAVVRDHRDRARWAGIAVGAVVLLFWPQPTLSVLIWIVALVALYLWALEWLQNRAPEPAPQPARAPGAPTVPGAGAEVPRARSGGNGPLVPSAVVPASRAGTTDGTPAGAALTPQVIETLNGRLDLLVRLGAARDSGVLTDDEFHHEKDRLLGL
jgi:hypothetical protein